MSVRQRKKSSRKNLPEQDYMGAQAMDELYDQPAKWQTWLMMTGKHREPSVQEYVFNFALEFIGCFLLAALVTVVRGVSGSGNAVLNGFMVGIVYAATYYFVQTWPCNYALRRHLNWAVSFAYFWLNEIGLAGFITYSAVQVLGALAGGAFASGFVVIDAAQPTVPVPTTLISTTAYALGLEFLGSFLIVFALLANEFYATPATGETEEERTKHLSMNHHRAVGVTAMCIFVLCIAFFPMQSYTFNNVTYLGGLFAGFHKADPIRHISSAARLAVADVPNSVFTIQAAGNAYANYVFMPLLGSLAAVGVFVALFAMYVYRDSTPWNFKVSRTVVIPRGEKVQPGTDMVTPGAASYIEQVADAQMQTRVSDLSSPYHRMH